MALYTVVIGSLTTRMVAYHQHSSGAGLWTDTIVSSQWWRHVLLWHMVPRRQGAAGTWRKHTWGRLPVVGRLARQRAGVGWAPTRTHL